MSHATAAWVMMYDPFLVWDMQCNIMPYSLGLCASSNTVLDGRDDSVHLGQLGAAAIIDLHWWQEVQLGFQPEEEASAVTPHCRRKLVYSTDSPNGVFLGGPKWKHRAISVGHSWWCCRKREWTEKAPDHPSSPTHLDPTASLDRTSTKHTKFTR